MNISIYLMFMCSVFAGLTITILVSSLAAVIIKKVFKESTNQMVSVLMNMIALDIALCIVILTVANLEGLL